MVTKTHTTSAKSGPASGGKSVAPKAPRKPRVVKPKVHEVKDHAEAVPADAVAHKVEPKAEAKHHEAKGRYVFATGRRKTSVANVRLFEGEGKHVINKKPFEAYFTYDFYRETALKPFDATGLAKKYHIVAHINGGGAHSQAVALRHGLSVALAKASEEVRKVLKKNGFLTRDDRKKERKKPGLKRARRAPQWAKR